MKPYNLITRSSSTSGVDYSLHERDGVTFLHANGQPITSTKESHCEEELAQMMAQPFRPARQPRLLVIGLGTGSYLNEVSEALPQSKAHFEVIEVNPDARKWFSDHLASDPETLQRTEFHLEDVSSFLKTQHETYHGIFFDPELWRGLGSEEDLTNKLYLNYLVSSLKTGGLLGMVTDRPDKVIQGRMERCGLQVTIERVPAVTGGKRLRTIWLAKKGHYRK